MKPIYLDIETSGLDVFKEKITLIQILEDNKKHISRNDTK